MCLPSQGVASLSRLPSPALPSCVFLQEKMDAAVDAHQQALFELESKFQAEVAGPLIAERADIVSGKVEAPGAEEEAGSDIKGIPGFWLQAMKSIPVRPFSVCHQRC